MSARAILAGHRGLIGHGIAAQLRGVMPMLTAGRQDADIALDLARPAAAFGAFAPEDVFIHAAGITDEELTQTPAEAVARATIAFDALLGALCKAGLKRFVYISSAHVLGPLEGDLSEASAANPMSLYALMHFAGEQLLRRYVYQGRLESALVLRPCAVYGALPDLQRFARWSLIPYSFPKEAAEKQTITLLTPGLQERNFVSIETIGRTAAELAGKNHSGFRIIHPKGHFTGTVLAFAQLCAEVYRGETGKACKVLAPVADSNTALPVPLAFHCAHIIPEAPDALSDYLKHMIQLLSKHSA